MSVDAGDQRASTTVRFVLAFVGGGHGVPVPFALFWLGALGWNAYWWLFRIVYRMRLDAGVLEWHTPVRSGQLPLAEITLIRSIALLPSVLAIRRRNGRALLILAGKGLPAFVGEAVETQPEIDVHLGRWARVADRVPGPSAWRPGE
jgi:hypothetical protein